MGNRRLSARLSRMATTLAAAAAGRISTPALMCGDSPRVGGGFSFTRKGLDSGHFLEFLYASLYSLQRMVLRSLRQAGFPARNGLSYTGFRGRHFADMTE